MANPLPSDVRALLDGPNIAHVATVLPGGVPHSVPTWVATTDDGARAMFLTGPRSRKARNLDHDPRASLSLTEAGNPLRMAHLRGRVVARIDGNEGWRIIDQIAQKYLGGPYPRGVDRVVYVVEAEHAVSFDFS